MTKRRQASLKYSYISGKLCTLQTPTEEDEWSRLESVTTCRPLRFAHLASSRDLVASVHPGSKLSDGFDRFAWPRQNLRHLGPFMLWETPTISEKSLAADTCTEQSLTHISLLGNVASRELSVATIHLSEVLRALAYVFGGQPEAFLDDGIQLHIAQIDCPERLCLYFPELPSPQLSGGCKKSPLTSTHIAVEVCVPGFGANNIPFPLPRQRTRVFSSARAHRRKCEAPESLLALWCKLGTWLVPQFALQESLELRKAASMQLEAPVCMGSDESRVCMWSDESWEWSRILATKRRERRVWGCFDVAAFPAAEMMQQVIPSNLSLATFTAQCSSECTVESFRTSVHADTTAFDCSIDADRSPAWTEVEANVFGDAVASAEWEELLGGKWCCREVEAQAVFSDDMQILDDWLCVICLDEEQSSAVAICCSHVFHRACISSWLARQGRCPLCRRRSLRPPLPPMDFDLSPWPMLPEDAIAGDSPTERQLQTLRERAARHFPYLTMGERTRRLSSLARRFRREAAPSFFVEVSPAEREVQEVAVVERNILRLAEEAEARERLEEAGAALAEFPVQGRWSGWTWNENPRFASRRQLLLARSHRRRTHRLLD